MKRHRVLGGTSSVVVYRECDLSEVQLGDLILLVYWYNLLHCGPPGNSVIAESLNGVTPFLSSSMISQTLGGGGTPILSAHSHSEEVKVQNKSKGS